MDDPEETSKSAESFWAQTISPTGKAWMLGILALCFVSQTYLVYSDPTPTRVLVGEELAGRRVWLANNCQACHQLYGFGGFLGPDLTNAASRLQKPQLADRLALGKGQMPKFDLPEDDVTALWEFLSAMNETGIGQARNPVRAGVSANGIPSNSPSTLAVQKILKASGDQGAISGFEIYRSYTCVGCHVLFGESAIGAPDLSLSGLRLSAQEIQSKLEMGVPPLMPPSGLSAEKRAQVQAFITFLGEHREEALALVEESTDDAFWDNLPWWEF
ncbi:MAG: cytochrome c [Planctomycetota bacterium]|nr:cytochrome c [Planctomycetota bacterium]MDA1113914.1 cytochrome c [Planctomycetota bacterium]